jgi:hypothetical protein
LKNSYRNLKGVIKEGEANGRTRHRYKNCLKTDHEEKGGKVWRGFRLTQDRVKQLDVVNMMMNLRV